MSTTGTDGRYYFHGAPRGVYTLEVWVEENLPSTFPIQVSSQPLTRVPDEFALNLPLIESVLANSNSSDRLLLGAVSALNKMNCPYTLKLNRLRCHYQAGRPCGLCDTRSSHQIR